MVFLCSGFNVAFVFWFLYFVIPSYSASERLCVLHDCGISWVSSLIWYDHVSSSVTFCLLSCTPILGVLCKKKSLRNPFYGDSIDLADLLPLFTRATTFVTTFVCLFSILHKDVLLNKKPMGQIHSPERTTLHMCNIFLSIATAIATRTLCITKDQRSSKDHHLTNFVDPESAMLYPYFSLKAFLVLKKKILVLFTIYIYI